jgi:hypothetical protein
MTDRLYGFDGDEHLDNDPEDTYERWADDNMYDPETTPVDERPTSLTILEWSVEEDDPFVIKTDRIVENIVEWYADECGDICAADRVEAASKHPDVMAAFDAARKLFVEKIGYKWAKDRVGEIVVTFDDDGQPVWPG